MKDTPSWEAVPFWIRKLGVQCWLLLGIAACVGIVAAFLSAISGLVVPFVIALVVATIFHPVVDRLEGWGINRMAGSLGVVVVLIGVLLAVSLVMVRGIFTQTDEMVAQVKAGVTALSRLAAEFDVSGELVQELGTRAINSLPSVASGAASIFTSGLSGSFAFFIGSFAAVFILFYLMYDWHHVLHWMAGSVGLPRDLGTQLIGDATGAVREYFYALTLSSIVVALTIGTTMALLKLPLALTIGLVTMVTSYIPYLGAIFAGAFAVLIALGAGGLQKALIVTLVVLVLQNIIQTVIQNKLASDRLKLHPIVTFCTVIGGGLLFGVLGATLANPVAAMIGTFRKRLADYEAQQAERG